MPARTIGAPIHCIHHDMNLDIPHALPSRPASAPRVALLLLALTALLMSALGLHGPVLQWPDYHAFANQRAWLGIPQAADVLSNLPFAVVGLWGLWRLHDDTRPASAAWRLFCLALVATAAGSTRYHLGPDNHTLAFDRLPIAWACTSLLCAFLAERFDARAARPAALAIGGLLASASVAWWWWGDLHGAGDLRAYLCVQFLPMLLVPAALLADRKPRPGTVPAAAWWGVLALYALAKVMELADHVVFDALGLISGHTLKHLFAAAGAACLVAGFRPPRAISCGSPR